MNNLAVEKENSAQVSFSKGSYVVLCYLLLLDLVMTFIVWQKEPFITLSAIKANSAVCPPYFKECLSLYFLDTLPTSYGVYILYTLLFSLVVMASFFLYKKMYKAFIITAAVPLLYKVLYLYFLTYLATGNYASLGIFFGIILLFSTYKLFYLRLVFLMLYLCASVIKLHDGYLSGEVFSSLSLGVPFFPGWTIPYLGVAFLLFCIIAPLGLIFSKREHVRNWFLLFLILFHVYSSSMVGFRYPLLIIPILFILWYHEKEHFIFKKEYLKDVVGVIVIVSMIILQVLPLFIKGDERITGEGYKYGYYMYDGNHQCESVKEVVFTDGGKQVLTWYNKRALFACDPYEEWFKIQRVCASGLVASVTWRYDHSLNGAPYRRIIDEKNACNLKYMPFKHNAWIKENRPAIATPVFKNGI